MKKALSVLMALCLLLSVGSALAQEEKADFTLWLGLESANYFTNSGENPAWYKAEEATGVQVEYLNPSAGAGDEAFNLMIVGNELPDAIIYNWIDFPGGPNAALENNVLIELTEEMLKEHAPDYYAYLEAWPEIKKMVTTDDSKHYQLAGVMTWEQNETKGLTPILEREPYYEAWLGLIVDESDLKAIGEKKPVTIQDWTRVLTAFKDQLGMAAPFAGTLNYVKQSNCFAGAFDITHGLYQDKAGKVHYGPAEDAYLDYLTLLNDWYTQGLIDPDFSALDGNSSKAKMVNGEAGVMIGTGGWIGGVYDSARELDEKSQVYPSAVPMPTLNADDEAPGYSLKNSPCARGGIGITTACKNPEKVLEFFNYYWTLEGCVLANWGVEAADYVLDANGLPVYPQGSEKQKINYILNGPIPTDMRNRLEMMKAYDTPEPYAARGIWGNAESDCSLPPIVIPSDSTMDYANIGNELKTYADEMFIKFVMGLEPLTKFEEYRQNLKNMQLDLYLSIAQTGMDNYNAR